VPQNNRWNTYGFTFSTGPGQTSVKLTLRNNAPGGTGNDLGLDNINFSACGPQASVASDIAGAICDNEAHPVLTAIIAADSGFVQWQQRVPPAWDWQSIPGATDRTYASGALGPGLHVFRYLYASTAASLANPRCRIASDSIVIEVIPVTFTVRDTLCDGLSYTLGDTVITTSGTYTHTFMGSKGCDSIVTLEIFFVPDPGIIADFATQPPSCFGADDGLVSVLSISGTRPPYAFIVNDSIIPPPGMAASFPAGTYTVRIEDPNGCYDEEVLTIPDGQPFDMTLTGETLIPLGHSTILVASGTPIPDAVSWKPEEAVSCGFCTEVIVTPLEDQWFTVIGTTAAGCIDSARLEVRVDRTPIIYVPNVFTPDGNGINDTWRITLDPLNIPVIRTVYIFDRWGDMFLAVSDLPTMAQMDLWTGETPWGRAGPGTYVYMLVARLADGEEVRFSGDVTLIR
jgi:gliding motility-associated-like protein